MLHIFEQVESPSAEASTAAEKNENYLGSDFSFEPKRLVSRL